MFYKIIDGKVKNSRTPLEDGFEKEGLEFECDSQRLVAVGDDDCRDMTNEELFERAKPEIMNAMFSAADAYMSAGVSPAAYAYTCMMALQGVTKASDNLEWAQSIWSLHDERVDTITADNFMELTEELFDYSSLGEKPHSVRSY